MARDRDVWRPKTPPAEVRAQTAGEIDTAQNWDDLTPPAGSPALLPSETLNKLDRRLKTTSQTSQATLDHVAELRREFDGRLGYMSAKVDTLVGDLADVRAATARNEGKLDGIGEGLAADRERTRQVTQMTVTAFQAGVEVDRTRALSQIDVQHSQQLDRISERKEQRRARRRMVINILAGVSAVWALIQTLVTTRC